MAYHPGINAAIYCHSSELPCMSGSITSLHTSLLPFVSLLLFTSCSPYPFYTPFPSNSFIADNPMPEKTDPIAQLVTHSLEQVVHHNKKLLICIFNLDGSLKTNKQNIILKNSFRQACTLLTIAAWPFVKHLWSKRKYFTNMLEKDSHSNILGNSTRKVNISGQFQPELEDK